MAFSPSEQELRDAIVKLEHELDSREDTLAELNEERARLEQNLKNRDKIIQNLSAKKDQKKQSIRQLDDERARKDRAIRELQDEKELLDELEMVNQMSLRKISNEPSGGPPEKISPDTLARIERLRSEHRAMLQKRGQLEEEAGMRSDDLTAKADELDKLYQEIQFLSTLAATDASGSGPNADQNALAYYQGIVAELEEEQRTNKTMGKKTTSLIEQLYRQLDERKGFEAELKAAKEQLKERKREHAAVKADIKEAQLLLQKRDKMLDRLEAVNREDDEKPLKAAENEKRFLQAEISKLNSAKRTQDRTIRAQQHRLEQLQGRLEMIVQELKHQKSDPSSPLHDLLASERVGGEDGHLPGEPVPVEVFELLMSDLEGLRKALSQKDEILAERDAAIESWEKKIQVVHRVKKTEESRWASERRECQNVVEDLQLELQQLQECTAAHETLSGENERLKQRLNMA
eukprot:NODE_1014_length_1616_cov_14.841736_g838_i0.p2 GENE.NODE_1014_length_1616_cov_14.841736_g838_i0~~NODE_1014_length_1616_cov_14.841736_g838_i0.p2  ORF type:complete len:462 (+),score=180.10 NODE_1014_length_1616_cov_14.841736_g838_i0:103-1488(+)